MSGRLSFASGANTAFLENMYEAYKKDPDQLDDSWRRFFEGYEFALSSDQARLQDPAETSGPGQDHARIEAYINTYRRLGHLYAHLDPLSDAPRIPEEMLPPAHGLGKIPEHQTFTPANFGRPDMSFDEIRQKLIRTYCGSIGADFRELKDIKAMTWLQEQMEGCDNRPALEEKDRLHILTKLVEAESFERFLQTRYLGQKRFSLEGLEALIPLLDTIIEEASEQNVQELCMGMAHRGRLNVLANIIGKPFVNLLSEFEGSQVNPFDIDGDVKYHMGFASTVTTRRGKTVDLFLSPNPSHLEAVNPVVEGFTRSRQDCGPRQPEAFLPVLLHGDASFIGQGIVAETLNLANLREYTTGGTIHVITNNQIGFTTNPTDSRSCCYSSDIAKVNRAPVFHVNSDYPESVAFVAKLAVSYQRRFSQDVVIDLVGYRRHGHNETDEPTFTQPQMYQAIKGHKSVLSLYSESLMAEDVISGEALGRLRKSYQDRLQKAWETVRSPGYQLPAVTWPESLAPVFQYRKASRSEVLAPVTTALPMKIFKEAGRQILDLPKAFRLHPKLKRILANRAGMLDEGAQIDWAFAELLAFASLAKEGFRVRLSGQDCKRGTFSSRHGVLCDQLTGQYYEPLNQIPGAAPVQIINSPLSEQGCLGFEFGYSIASHNSLVLWEAQFGDFVNGAQIIIDQFISASESKWHLTSGLVLLLPHGFEGMGPEHSSARPERFLQQCGNINMQVCNATTPAQYFHLLRRQMHRSFRKPLILMTPKSLLRHPEVRSQATDFSDLCFREILDDEGVRYPEKAEKVIFCTGKVYYELVQTRSRHQHLSNVPVIRVEQLYPFPFETVRQLLSERYRGLKEVIWVQEEPQNMGAWSFIRPRLKELLKERGIEARYLGRRHSGTTAEGAAKAHRIEQTRILEEAFGLVCGWNPSEHEKRFSGL